MVLSQPLPLQPSQPSSSGPVLAAASASAEHELYDRLSKLVEVKSKIPEFSGQAADWEEYKWRLSLLIEMISRELQADMKATAHMTVQQIAAAEAASPLLNARSLLLYKLLAAGCRGRALATVRLQPQASGLAAWSQLQKEYVPANAFRFTSMLSNLMQPQFSLADSFVPQLLSWEQRVSDYVAKQQHHSGQHEVRNHSCEESAPGQTISDLLHRRAHSFVLQAS